MLLVKVSYGQMNIMLKGFERKKKEKYKHDNFFILMSSSRTISDFV